MWVDESADWGELGGLAPYPDAQPMTPQAFNSSAGSWSDVLKQGISTAATVALLREQTRAGINAPGSQVRAGQPQSPWALSLPPGSAARGNAPAGASMLAGYLPWVLIAGAAVAAVLLIRR